MASAGYPDAPRKGDLVRGLPEAEGDFHVFHAGTALAGNDLVTSGGRVLAVTALGHNVKTAQRRAYDIVGRIQFEGMQYRRDIGHRAVSARRKNS
jgi:phosphoribosylamine--glycine ligase